MNSQQLMLNAINGGLEDDATTSAALDAIREESNCSLLAAVLEVARVWKAARDAREHTDAVKLLAEDSPYRDELQRSILAECLNVPEGTSATIVTVEGDQWPHAVLTPDWTAHGHPPVATVTVGAVWVKREATSIQIERERVAYQQQQQRKNLKGRRAGRARQ